MAKISLALLLMVCGAAATAPSDLDTCDEASLIQARLRQASLEEEEEGEEVQTAKKPWWDKPKPGKAQCGDPSWVFACTAPTPAPFAPPTPAPVPWPVSCPSETAFPWCNTALNTKERAELLVKEMNITQLAEQVSCNIFGGVPEIVTLGVNTYNYIQEGDHGLLLNGQCPTPTMFPQQITMGATFNKELHYEIGRAQAIEARFNYNLGNTKSLWLQTNYNVFLDPRWGRGQEVASECPFTNSEYLKHWSKGVQAPEGPGGVPLAVMSCKHFTAYSLEGAGGYPFPLNDSNRHNFNAVVPKVDLADTHFPMYEECAKSGSLGMMTSYNAVNGVPMSANGPFTNGLARDKWGFRGTVCTDCGAVGDIYLRHKFVKTGAEAARVALEGGTDIECGDTIKTFGAVEQNRFLLEQAVTRTFNVRFELGEFNPPTGDEIKDYDRAAHAKLAFDAAVQGSVLLRNDKKALPLKKGSKIALMGPMATVNWQLLGNYAAYPDNSNFSNYPEITSIRQGLEQCEFASKVFNPSPPRIDGPFICSNTDDTIPAFHTFNEEPEDADVAVLAMGLYPQDEQLMDPDIRPQDSGMCQAGCLESEGCDRGDMYWPKGQRLLMEKAATWKIPLVIIIVAAGPLDLSFLHARTGPTAILWMGYPGQMAGIAAAHMLFGLESPSGKLSQTYYKASYGAALPIDDLHMRPNKKTGFPGRSYRFVDEKKWVQYPFGYGLSYNRWKFTLHTPQLSLEQEEAGKKKEFASCVIQVDLDLKLAIGKNPMEAVLLFLIPPKECPLAKLWEKDSPGALAPLKELKGFDKVKGPKGSATFELGKEHFQLAGEDGNFQLYEGEWHAEIGSPAVLGPIPIKVKKSGCKVKTGFPWPTWH